MPRTAASSNRRPGELGYRMPAEWHPHAATQLHWPSNRETWPGACLARVERVYGDILAALTPHEQVHLLAENEAVRERAGKVLEDFAVDPTRITWHVRPINDVWARDCGPIFVRREEAVDGDLPEWALTDWEYNAWGGKYPPWEDDNALPAWFARRFGIPRYAPGMVLEGGSIEVNGEGALLTTESVLLNPNRNPALDRGQIEDRLRAYLGADHVIWLKEGLTGDDTDGHIDDLARFLAPDTVLAVTAPPGDVNHAALAENLEILRSATLPGGRSLRIETLPLPETRIEGTTVDGSAYVPASYANFYVASGVVLVPLYDTRRDGEALELIGSHFPDREVDGISCADLVWGQGSIHCVTQQLYGLPSGHSPKH
ncbi:MAG: agmatine deiminase family protein [Balneolaceae bacterium]|nr:agmatine deiminase family protein [Balneolaceae bacterium]